MQEPKLAEVIDLFQKPKPEPFCSFCKRKKSETKKLFSNGLKGLDCRNICDSCVTLAKTLIDRPSE